MINSLRLWPILLILSSCALIVKWDQDKHTQNNPNKEKKITYCNASSSKKDILASTNPNIFKHYENISTKLRKYQLKFIDKFVLLALIQINLRPDLASPTANLYALLNIQGQKKYFAFTYKNSHSMPYLTGLEKLLIIYKSHYRLNNFANWLNNYFTKNKLVSKNFSKFLTQQQLTIQKYPIFKKHLFKAEQPLKTGESLPHLNYVHLIRKFSKKNRQITIRNHLFDYSPAHNNTSDLNISCNYDFNLYTRSQYLIAPKIKPNLPLSLADHLGNSIMAISSQDMEYIRPLKGTFLFSSYSKHDPIALCFLNNLKLKTELSLISTTTRDPGQLIYHLVQYEIFNSKNLYEASEYINFPRHLFLLRPVRMLYESERGSKDQLNRFLSMNFPLYHANNIGNLWLHGKFKNNNENGLIIDTRGDNYLSCRYKD